MLVLIISVLGFMMWHNNSTNYATVALTLRDYTNYIKGRLGFQSQVMEMLQKESGFQISLN